MAKRCPIHHKYENGEVHIDFKITSKTGFISYNSFRLNKATHSGMLVYFDMYSSYT